VWLHHPPEAGPGWDEDYGWYLTLVHDVATDLSELVVLDASAPDAAPVARVHLPTRVPLGFHGSWVPTPR
jgi:carotenoid cleavage dioxygenase